MYSIAKSSLLVLSVEDVGILVEVGTTVTVLTMPEEVKEVEIEKNDIEL